MGLGDGEGWEEESGVRGRERGAKREIIARIRKMGRDKRHEDDVR